MRNWFKSKNKVTMVIWCNYCQAEPAKRTVEVEVEDQWIPLDVGKNCLKQLSEYGKL